MDWISKVLLLIEPKTIATNFQEYIRIYTHPFSCYKKVLTTRRSSLEYITLHLIYYGLILFLLSMSLLTVLRVIGLELIMTIIPFIAFIVPYILAKKAIGFKNRVNRLFRVILLIKVQLIPILAFTLIIAESTKNSFSYYLTENLIWIIWLLLIFIPPIVLTKTKIQLFSWIIGNYISFLVFIIISSFALSLIIKTEGNYNKYISFTPNLEFVDFQSKYYNSDKLIIDSLFLGEISTTKNGEVYLSSTQFVTPTLHLLYIGSQLNSLLEDQKLTDSILTIIDTNHISKRHEYDLKMKASSDVIDTLKLSRLRKLTNLYFYDDLKIVKTFRDSTSHDRNRKFYTSLYDYLKKYESTYLDSSMISNVLKKMELEEPIKISTNRYLFLTKVDPIIYEPNKSKYLYLEKEFENKFKKSNVVFNILFYPFTLIEKAYNIR